MKKMVVKEHGDIKEKIEIIDEEQWVYVHYWRGDYEKKTMFLIEKEKSLEAYFKEFYAENDVSYEMAHEVTKIVRREKDNLEFLLKASSLHLGIGVMFALCCLIGFQIGTRLDSTFATYPLFTIICLFAAIGFAGFTGYKMFQKYLKPNLK